MPLNYSVPGQVSINISHYVTKMPKEFTQENLEGSSVASQWDENLFKVQHDSVPLEKEQAKLFHTMTARGILLCKCGHPDSIPNYMGTKTKSCRLDKVMLTVAISQAACEGQANRKSRWLRMP